MPLQKAARVGAVVGILFALGLLLHQLPVVRLLVGAAKTLHGLGSPGAALTFICMYALTLLLLPIIPLVVACGWLYGIWGSALSLAAAVASASTAFAAARGLGRSAAAEGSCGCSASPAVSGISMPSTTERLIRLTARAGPCASALA